MENALAKLRYTVGPSTLQIEVVPPNSTTDGPVATDTFTVRQNYQLGSEVVKVTNIADGNDSTTLTVPEHKIELLHHNTKKISQFTELY